MWLLPFRFINWMYTIYFCQAYIVKPITVLYRIVRIHTMYNGIWWFGADSFSSLARLLSLIFLQDLGSDNTRFQYLNSFYWYCALSHSLLAVSFNIKIDIMIGPFPNKIMCFKELYWDPNLESIYLVLVFTITINIIRVNVHAYNDSEKYRTSNNTIRLRQYSDKVSIHKYPSPVFAYNVITWSGVQLLQPFLCREVMIDVSLTRLICPHWMRHIWCSFCIKHKTIKLPFCMHWIL